MKRLILFGILLVATIKGISQDCNNLRLLRVDTNSLAFLDTLLANQDCSGLDLFDLEFCSPYWHQFYYETKRDSGTYDQFFSEYKEFKKTDHYKEYRAGNQIYFEFKHLPISDSTWNKAVKKLKHQGVSISKIKKYQKFLSKNPEYKEHGIAWGNYRKKKLTKYKE